MLPISVVIPVYNAEKFLKETIDSVLNQTFGDFELIIVDGSSTDRSSDIIFSYNDKRIRYVLSKYDFVGTHRKGYQSARGKYIAQLDHDDIMVPERLEIQFNFMESNPEIDACSGHMLRFGKDSYLSETVYTNHEDIALVMILGLACYNSAGFFKREFLIKNRIKHQRGYSVAADFKLWSDIAKLGKLANIPEILIHYRTSNTQASVVYSDKAREGIYKVRNEMVNFFLSKLNFKSDFGKVISEKILIPINILLEEDFFSYEVYFSFMYELIKGLKLKNEIQL